MDRKRGCSVYEKGGEGKGKGMFLKFYIAQYPVRRTAQSTLHFSSPGRSVHSDTNSASLGSILAMQQIAQRLFTHMSTTVYSQVLIYTAESTEAS